MTGTIPWYMSRTVWASLLTILMSLAGLFDMRIDAADATTITDAVMQLVTAVAGAAALFGRLSARNRIG